jgi:hypothetical protein
VAELDLRVRILGGLVSRVPSADQRIERAFPHLCSGVPQAVTEPTAELTSELAAVPA